MKILPGMLIFGLILEIKSNPFYLELFGFKMDF